MRLPYLWTPYCPTETGTAVGTMPHKLSSPEEKALQEEVQLEHMQAKHYIEANLAFFSFCG